MRVPRSWREVHEELVHDAVAPLLEYVPQATARLVDLEERGDGRLAVDVARLRLDAPHAPEVEEQVVEARAAERRR